MKQLDEQNNADYKRVRVIVRQVRQLGPQLEQQRSELCCQVLVTSEPSFEDNLSSTNYANLILETTYFQS